MFHETVGPELIIQHADYHIHTLFIRVCSFMPQEKLDLIAMNAPLLEDVVDLLFVVNRTLLKGEEGIGLKERNIIDANDIRTCSRLSCIVCIQL